MLCGIALARWFGCEAKRVYVLLNEDGRDRRQRQLLELVQRLGGFATSRDVLRSSRLFRTAAESQHALDELIAAGYGHWEDLSTGVRGRPPALQFRLRPRIDNIDKNERA